MFRRCYRFSIILNILYIDGTTTNKIRLVYRGEIKVALHNHNADKLALGVENGERIAQIVITPYIKADFETVEELEDTDRGESGFGSTGKF